VDLWRSRPSRTQRHRWWSGKSGNLSSKQNIETCAVFENMFFRRVLVTITANRSYALRKNSTSCHKLIVTQYGDPAKSLAMTEETLAGPKPNEVCFHSLLVTFSTKNLLNSIGESANAGCHREPSRYQHNPRLLRS
jgi:hypothetical protein